MDDETPEPGEECLGAVDREIVDRQMNGLNRHDGIDGGPAARHQPADRVERVSNIAAPMRSTNRATLEGRKQSTRRASAKASSIPLQQADGRARQACHLTTS